MQVRIQVEENQRSVNIRVHKILDIIPIYYRNGVYLRIGIKRKHLHAHMKTMSTDVNWEKSVRAPRCNERLSMLG